MTTTDVTSGLRSFDDVRRGDAAPEWVRDGIVTAWRLSNDAAVQLIVLSENITFRVTVSDMPSMVVRLGRPGYAESIDHVRSELLWVEALRDDVGVRTPAPVRGWDGGLVQSLTSPDGAVWSAVAFEWVPGTVLEEQDDFARHYVEIGRVTALLHDHARRWQPPTGFVRFTWDIPDMVGDTARWGDWRRASALSVRDKALLERAEEAAAGALAATTAGRGPLALIHADLRPSNVITTSDGLTVIDFDDCGYGYPLYDFGAALTFYEHRPDAPGIAADWLDGYRSVAPLSADDLDAAAALSMLRRLTMLGWATTHRADALPVDLWEENLPGTVAVGERYLADPRWLVRG